LEWVETTAWGGLSLTFIISIFALLFCFPVGMFLALGRRSSAPVIRYSSIGFIEFWRGVPLITVLFMASVMMPMFLPDGTYMDKLVRVIIAITLFEAAYMAEVIRGGLQALPRGQYDAGKSLGMGYWRMHLLVILPQALSNKGEHFGLKISGDSMIEAGINDGDTVIVRKTNTADNGQIVVALIDDHEAMLKRIRKKGKVVALESANKSYETKIFGPDRVKIQGVLVSLYRNF